MLSLVISSEKKDSSMHTKIQWNMSQNCEQTGEDVVSADGGAAPYSDSGLKRKNRSKSGFFLFQMTSTSSGCLFGDFIGLAFAIGYKHIATAPHGLQIAGVAIVFFNQFSQARKLHIQAAIEGLV